MPDITDAATDVVTTMDDVYPNFLLQHPALAAQVEVLRAAIAAERAQIPDEHLKRMLALSAGLRESIGPGRLLYGAEVEAGCDAIVALVCSVQVNTRRAAILTGLLKRWLQFAPSLQVRAFGPDANTIVITDHELDVLQLLVEDTTGATK